MTAIWLAVLTTQFGVTLHPLPFANVASGRQYFKTGAGVAVLETYAGVPVTVTFVRYARDLRTETAL
jgi:hypothetical protein